jgi:hypothetical protein
MLGSFTQVWISVCEFRVQRKGPIAYDREGENRDLCCECCWSLVGFKSTTERLGINIIDVHGLHGL